MPPPDARAAVSPEPSAPARTPLPALVVFSHLRWGAMVRRPQHLLSRLAREFRVFFIEEPVFGEGTPVLLATCPQAGLEVLTPRTPVAAPGFHDAQQLALEALLAQFAAERHIDEPVAWLTTPMALPLAADFEPRAVVYDCGEDFADAPDAPRQLLQREEALLDLADIVLTASPALHAVRRARYSNLHCLPSAVDAAHFARPAANRLECAAARALHEGLPRPRLGFFGMIDERVDLELVAAIADSRPGWQLVMVGPVAPGVADALPRRPNIRWLGEQSYDMLPHLQSHWDVCLLPLRQDATTLHAAPAQTLEYLAGGKPVVAVPLADVVALHGAVVRLAPDAPAFVAAIEAALAETPAQREQRRLQAQAVVDASSWDESAAVILELLREFVRPASMRALSLEIAPEARGLALPPLPAAAARRGGSGATPTAFAPGH